MSRDYEHEKWIAWYVEDTAGWLELSLAARGAMAEIARKLNARGELALRRGLPSLSVILRLRWEGELEPAIAELISAGKIVWDATRLVLADPDYLSRKRRTSADRMREKRLRDSRPPPSSPAPSDACDARDVTSVTPEQVTGVTAVLVSSSLVSSDLISDLPEGESAREGTEPEARPSTARYAEAYAAGIARGKGGAFAWPGTKYAEWDVGKIIKSFAKDPAGKPYRGGQLLRFIEHTAAEFAADVLAKGVAKFYFAFEPRGCLKWLNENETAEEARHVG